MRPRLPILAAVALVSAAFTVVHAAPTAPKAAEDKSDPVQKALAELPDFSRAGYACGERKIPAPPAVDSVRKYGAKGDGKTDDTKAFQAALAKAKPGALMVPAGTYLLSDKLTLKTSGVVLRGAGPDKTKLLFTRPLDEIAPQPTTTSEGSPTSAYSWSGGLIQMGGWVNRKEVAAVQGRAARGATSLQVDAKPGALEVGQELLLQVGDGGDQSLGRYLYGGEGGDLSNWKGMGAAQSVRIAAIRGNQVKLDRPIRFELRPEWKPRLLFAKDELTEAGIEDLAIAFPSTPYGGHFKEVGFNAVSIGGAVHCFVRRLRIENADSGVFCGGRQCTLADITLASGRKPDGHLRCTGHHGISLGSCDNLLTGFKFETRFIHDITVSGGSIGNVAENGTAADLALDHHCHGPYENLFCNLDAGAGTRLYFSGGGKKLGWNCGANTVFWGIKAQQPLPPPKAGWAPKSLLLVGVTEGKSDYRTVPVAFEKLAPPNPREAQLKQRLRR